MNENDKCMYLKNNINIFIEELYIMAQWLKGKFSSGTEF